MGKMLLPLYCLIVAFLASPTQSSDVYHYHVGNAAEKLLDLDTYEKDSASRRWQTTAHNCDRKCGDEAKTCVFILTASLHKTMSSECGSCGKERLAQDDFDCSARHCIPGNGAERETMVFNQRMPGPQLRVCQGDRVVVHVINRLPDSRGISLHFHGITQRGTPHYDGVLGVTQCPIASGSAFVYNFTASDRGTHFYHASDLSMQSAGAFGALIVKEKEAMKEEKKEEKKEKSKEVTDDPAHVITIQDWNECSSADRINVAEKSARDDFPDALLINGVGVGKKSLARSRFHVGVNKTHRFRVIAAMTRCPVQLTVDGHFIKVIASDGNPVTGWGFELKTVALQLMPGERYDFLLEATQTPNPYWIHVTGLSQNCHDLNQRAILQYEGTPWTDPMDWAYKRGDLGDAANKDHKMVVNVWNSGQGHGQGLVKDHSMLADGIPDDATIERVDEQHYFWLDFNPSDGYKTPMINNVRFSLPSAPILTQRRDVDPRVFCRMDGAGKSFPGRMCADHLCQCAQLYPVKLGSVVELVLINEGKDQSMGWPVHLHGHKFRVLAQHKFGESIGIAKVMKMEHTFGHGTGGIWRKMEKPPLKDTIGVQDGGVTIVRFVADNPGYWLLDTAMANFEGMRVVFQVGEEEDMPETPAGWPTCGATPYDIASKIRYAVEGGEEEGKEGDEKEGNEKEGEEKEGIEKEGDNKEGEEKEGKNNDHHDNDDDDDDNNDVNDKDEDHNNNDHHDSIEVATAPANATDAELKKSLMRKKSLLEKLKRKVAKKSEKEEEVAEKRGEVSVTVIEGGVSAEIERKLADAEKEIAKLRSELKEIESEVKPGNDEEIKEVEKRNRDDRDENENDDDDDDDDDKKRGKEEVKKRNEGNSGSGLQGILQEAAKIYQGKK